MFVNLNETSLPVTSSSTPTAYAIPEGANRARIYNGAGGSIVVKGETSSTVTLVAPVAGTKFAGTAIPDSTSEMFDISTGITYISVYSAAGTGLVYIQFTYGE